MAEAPRRLRFALFTSFAPGGPPGAMWHHPAARDFDYLSLDHWAGLAQALERARFDAIFWADHTGVHDVYQGSYHTAVREAVQFPINDPLLLTAALAGATRDLGFAFSANVVQDQPYAFARKLSTLDHLTRGRIAWNIVTSFQPSAWRNMGHTGVPKHTARYEQAEEFVAVLYKLLEGSWEDDAVIRDLASGRFADPEKVHAIGHEGPHYTVPGIHICEPSPQRLPVLFQAGTSEDGRAFSARNAEAVFMSSRNHKGAAAVIADIKGRATAAGRAPDDILFFQHMTIITGSTEDEARRKDREVEDYLSSETNLAFYSSTMGADLAVMDLDAPIGDFSTEALQGQFKALAEAAPDKSWTFREVVVGLTRNRLVGAPEQIADALEGWHGAGVDGINLSHITGTQDVHAFLDHVVPVLQDRGLMQREYAAGTLREKLFAGTGAGPRVAATHPGAGYRPQPAGREER